MSRGNWGRAAALSAALLAVPIVTARADTAPPCTGPLPGGEWATYGGDLYGSQRQDQEHTINSQNVSALEQRWISADTGYQSPPPIVSGGCVFINTKGHIEAFDLET